MFLKNNEFAIERLISEYKKHNNLIIGVDFDDTIHDTFNRGLDVSGIIYLLQRLQQDFNCTLCVWTANQDEAKVREYWESIGLTIDHYNTSPLADQFPGPKPYFNILLDDRAGLDSSFEQLKQTYLQHIIRSKQETPDDTNIQN